jgi:diaminopimelate decarboxylase
MAGMSASPQTQTTAADPVAASPVYPQGSRVNDAGHLEIGGCDAVELAREYGTPLYVYDELTIRTRCAEYRDALAAAYPGSLVIYA